MSSLNKFDNDLAWSEKASDASFWQRIYERAFPSMVAQMPCPGDTESQRRGIDRLLLLSNGREVRIDEKKRRAEYDDILIEYVSNSTTGAPGWIEKDLAIDYVAYAFFQSKRCYLLDWLLLKRAWQKHGSQWKHYHQNIKARNQGYNTWSVAVPTENLLDAISDATVIEL